MRSSFDCFYLLLPVLSEPARGIGASLKRGEKPGTGVRVNGLGSR